MHDLPYDEVERRINDYMATLLQNPSAETDGYYYFFFEKLRDILQMEQKIEEDFEEDMGVEVETQLFLPLESYYCWYLLSEIFQLNIFYIYRSDGDGISDEEKEKRRTIYVREKDLFLTRLWMIFKQHARDETCLLDRETLTEFQVETVLRKVKIIETQTELLRLRREVKDLLVEKHGSSALQALLNFQGTSLEKIISSIQNNNDMKSYRTLTDNQIAAWIRSFFIRIQTLINDA